jgi:hypothetical protein
MHKYRRERDAARRRRNEPLVRVRTARRSATGMIAVRAIAVESACIPK